MNNMRIAKTALSTVSTFHRGEKRRMDHPQKEACSQLFYTIEDIEEHRGKVFSPLICTD